MAKKKGASRGAKKKSAPRGTRRKTAAKRRPASKPRTGLENPNKVDLTPLKAQLRAHIERLQRVKEPRSLQVQQTLDILQQTRQQLSSPCGLTMVLDVTQ